MALTKTFDLLPETHVYTGTRHASDMHLSIISYDKTSALMKHFSDINELMRYHDDSKISWIDVSGFNDPGAIKALGAQHEIHPLSIEDVLNTKQQPKAEVFGSYRFLSIKTIQREKNFHHPQERKKKFFNFFAENKKRSNDIDEFVIDQISIVIKKNVLITFQEIPGDSFDRVRKRLLDGMGEIRKMGTDYLAYAIIDAVVDEYYLTLNHLEEDIENYEDRATKTSDDKYIEELQDTKKYLSQIRRAISPLRDTMQTISRHEKFFQTDDLKPFLQDLNENLNNAIAEVDHYREWLSNIMAVNLSVLSHQMNKVMKVLAIISTVFIPLTFIAGVYGMNFEFMPELQYALSYPIVLSGMGLIALIMIIVFKIHHWF